jgi:phosphonopyruvate decarboxylase
MLIVIGWRGQTGVKDEPQHVKQGRVMAPLLDATELPWAVLPKDPADAEQCVKNAVATAMERSCPYVLMVEKDTFAEPATKLPKAGLRAALARGGADRAGAGRR